MTNPTSIHGILAEFDTVDGILHAAEKVKQEGYRKWDCHAPFPVHGLDGAMGIRQTRLPWLVLVMGFAGCSGGILLQWWTNAHDYVYRISGKPDWSLPANIPVAFEMTILFAALTAFFSMWILNGFPRWYSPLFRAKCFTRATDDRFVLAIDARDDLFGEETRKLLESLSPSTIEMIEAPIEDGKIPLKLKGILGIALTLLLLPPAMIANARFTKSTQPRVHIVPNMDTQVTHRGQEASDFFADGQAMRLPISGTYAQEDDRLIGEQVGFWTGKENGAYLSSIPMDVTPEFEDRGRARFGIYCSACHAVNGSGQGTVHLRAQELLSKTWVGPTDLRTDAIKQQAPGQLFESISNGIRNMPSYSSQIPAADRWAIVQYLKESL